MNVPPDDLFDLSIPLVEIPLPPSNNTTSIRETRILDSREEGKAAPLSEFIELNFGFLKFVFTRRFERSLAKGRRGRGKSSLHTRGVDLHIKRYCFSYGMGRVSGFTFYIGVQVTSRGRNGTWYTPDIVRSIGFRNRVDRAAHESVSCAFSIPK